MNWQTIIASSIVALAAAWLFRRAYRIVVGGSRGGQIGNCGACSKNKSTPTVVQFDATRVGGRQTRVGHELPNEES